MGDKTNPTQAKVEAIQRRLESELHANDPTLKPYSDLMYDAHDSSNGHAGDIAYLSKLVCGMAIVLTNEKLAEKQRLADAFTNLHTGACLFTPLVKRASDGSLIFPFATKEETAQMVEKMIAAKPEADAAEESLSVSKTGVKWTGKDAVKAGSSILKAVILVGVIWVLMGRNNAELKKELKVDRVQDIVHVLRATGVLAPVAAGVDTTDYSN